MKRAPFLAGTLALIGVTSLASYAAATKSWPVDAKHIAIGAIAVHAILVWAREQGMNESRKWRFMYILVVGLVASLFVDSVVVPSGYDGSDWLLRRAQAILGGYYLFLMLSVPAVVACMRRPLHGANRRGARS